MISIILITTLSFIFALLITTLEHILKKDDNIKKIEEVCELLPGYNCNACKTGSCMSLATLIIRENETPRRCKPIKEEEIKKIEEYLNKEV